MDRRFLRVYERELQHIRETAGEFAKEFPKIAGRLGIDGVECADPYVERLLEGFAFLASRVQLKLDAEFPRFTQNVLECVYPHYLAPTPSMAVVQFHPDPAEGGLEDGFTIPRGTSLRSGIGKGEQTACEYRTAQDVTLWPVQIEEAEYHTSDIGRLDLPGRLSPKAGIRLRLRTDGDLTFSEISLDSLVLYLHGAGQVPARLYEQVFAHAGGVVIRPIAQPAPWHVVLGRDQIRQVGFEDEQALLPVGPRSFQGYRLLHEYFAFAQRFLFMELRGLSPAMQRAQTNRLDLVILLDQQEPELEHVVDADCFQPNATPAINLFPKRADRIHVNDRFSEFHVVVDRTRPIDFEVFQVGRVTGFGATSDDEQEFHPFYSATDFETDDDRAFYATHRLPRVLSARERRMGRRSSYGGTEVYLSVVDASSAPYRADLRQLAIETTCTNRDLPLHMPVGAGETDFTMEVGAPVASIRCIAGPTPPRPSFAEGETAWRVISHFSLNYHSLTDTDDRAGASALRDLLRLYCASNEAHLRKQIEGVKSVRSRPVTRRVVTPGPIVFARGLEVELTLEEAGFEGTGVFLLGAVMDHFFARYVSINSFTETVVRSSERGVIKRWPARIGQTSTL